MASIVELCAVSTGWPGEPRTKGNMVVTLDREATDRLSKETLKERTGARRVSRRNISEMEKQGQRPRMIGGMG